MENLAPSSGYLLLMSLCDRRQMCAVKQKYDDKKNAKAITLDLCNCRSIALKAM